MANRVSDPPPTPRRTAHTAANMTALAMATRTKVVAVADPSKPRVRRRRWAKAAMLPIV